VEKITQILAVVERAEDGPIILDKAVSLARCFGAHVQMLIVDVAHAHALATHCRVMKYDEVTLTSLHRGVTPLHEIILRRIHETHPDLVIKAPAGAHALHRIALGENDWDLAQECPVPVLLVRHRAWKKPARFAAAVDVADRDNENVTRAILHTAGFLAMGFHGNLDVLYSEREKQEETVRIERAVRLAQLVREFHVGCERIQVFAGEPAKTLPPIASARKYDVLVLGARSREQGLQSIFGGTTSRMFEATEGDVVLVKAPDPNAARSEDQRPSRGKQRLHELEQFV
jgi:nucleotide-binding universal stress UspA family protein